MINSHVIDNYNQLSKLNTLRKNNPIFVLVYIPQCPYCHDMKPEWDRFKKNMNADSLDLDILEINKQLIGNVKEYNTNLYNHLDKVQFVPSINLLQNTQVEPYFGDRKSNSFKTFLMEKVKSIEEINSNSEKKPKKDTEKKSKKDTEKKSKKDTEKKEKKSKKQK